MICCFVFFKQKTAYEWRISDWISDVCSSDLSRTFLKRVILYASFSGRILRRKLANPSFAGRMKYQVGVRWSIVTCAASFIDGTMVTAVAPDPITTIFLPR